MSTQLHLEDLRVGQRFVSSTHALDADQIKRFAGEFDPQPFHLDENAATTSFFRGLAASGWHVAAITMRLLVGDGLPVAGGIIGASLELAWPTPTRPGDILHTQSELIEIAPSRSKPDRGIVTVRVETVKQGGGIELLPVSWTRGLACQDGTGGAVWSDGSSVVSSRWRRFD